MTSGADLRFPPAARLRKRAEFDRVYQGGERHSSTNMTVIFLAAENGPRVGFTAGRALGGAVVRNRIRRRLREAVRRHLRELRAPADVVFHPRKSALRADFSQLEAEVTRAFVVISKKLSR
ncbi:MAG: ribonuclease P protein component [Terriglobales bacterium]